ncbi:hypothetical protein ACJMK2_014542 [Sinanodonta woodiana]|uniref:LAGLIDADG homing endonuclease n=1 Tax=Sinanodonta woodiana TaxID=1069815 RepID=A0ABD3V288_SINWO
MPIQVYIWLPQGDNVGHSSMTLSDGTHISWWPSNKNFKKKSNIASIFSSRASLSESLKVDIYLEGNIQPNKVYILRDGFIKEAAIRIWWVSFSSNGFYRVFTQNCCHAVFKALEAGGAWRYITDEDVTSRGGTLLKPIDIDTLVNKLTMFLSKKKNKPPLDHMSDY